MRSLPVPHAPWKALLVLTLLSFALPTPAQAQAQTKTQTKAKTKAKARSKTKGKSPAAEPDKTPEKTQQTAPEQTPQKAPEPAPAPAPKAQTSEKTPAPKPPAPKPPEKVLPQSQVQAQERAEAQSHLRIGVALDLFTEKASMTGEQAINTSHTDESFDYSSSSFLSATLSMSVPAPIAKERARIGGGVRLFGNYSASGNRTFGFGLLNEAFILGEYGLPVADKTEVMFGARVGLSLLLPGHELSQEIERLQVQGVDVWSVPRLGWLAGVSAGVRRRMSEHILLRADVLGQIDKLYLFSTSQEIEGLQFEKHWSTFGLRIGLTLGIEFAL